ncbi:hypothetical protein, partial [Streptomyces cahuitamycinicus]|uniref:hypothetical protein n=1 Tax=Streptomyces cahuitamycinicus TaxID=2070367 RepID=UPI001CA5A9EE
DGWARFFPTTGPSRIRRTRNGTIAAGAVARCPARRPTVRLDRPLSGSADAGVSPAEGGLAPCRPSAAGPREPCRGAFPRGHRRARA